MKRSGLLSTALFLFSANFVFACSDSESSSPSGASGSGGSAGASGAGGSAAQAGSGGSSGSSGAGGSEAADEFCDPLVPTYCGYPFPSNRWTIDDNSTITKKRVKFDTKTLPKPSGVFDQDPSVFSLNDGFSPGNTILSQLPGATTDGLPSRDTMELSITTDSPTILLDAETGELVPHFSELDAQTNYDESRTFMMHPAVRLKDAHRYIVAIRNVVDNAGTAIEPSPAFKALRDNTESEFKSINDRKALYEDIFAKLEDAGIGRDNLQLAWDYTTASKENNTAWMVKMRDDALAAVGDMGPEYEVTNVEENPNEHIKRRITVKMKTPLFLSEVSPTARMNFGSDGMPKMNGYGDYEVEIQIPNSATTTPAPLLQNGHGLLGRKTEGHNGYLAEMADFKNYVTVTTDWVGFAEEDFNQVFYVASSGQLGEFQGVVERQQQGMLNALMAMRMMKGRFKDDPNVQFDMGGEMKSAIDPSLGCYYRGDSQGGILGTTYMALSTDVTRGLLGEPGFPYTLLLNRSADFAAYAAALSATYEKEARNVQFALALIQMLWDRIEPNGYAPYINGTDLLPNTPSHDVLIHAAIGDWQVTTLGAHILARTVGATNLKPVNRSIFMVPEAEGPIEGSAIVEYDFGLTEPVKNVPPSDGEDPHDKVRSLMVSYTQSDEFFRTGVVNAACDGPCDPE